jgi:hypothetical protein
MLVGIGERNHLHCPRQFCTELEVIFLVARLPQEGAGRVDAVSVM